MGGRGGGGGGEQCTTAEHFEQVYAVLSVACLGWVRLPSNEIEELESGWNAAIFISIQFFR